MSSDPHTTKKAFWPAHKNQVYFDPHDKNHVNLINKLKPRISRPAHEPDRFWRPHEQKVKFDPYAKTKSISLPQMIDKWISTPSLKSS